MAGFMTFQTGFTCGGVSKKVKNIQGTVKFGERADGANQTNG